MAHTEPVIIRAIRQDGPGTVTYTPDAGPKIGTSAGNFIVELDGYVLERERAAAANALRQFGEKIAGGSDRQTKHTVRLTAREVADTIEQGQAHATSSHEISAHQDDAERRFAEIADVDKLAQIIRRVDGNHSLGAGALADAIADSGLLREIWNAALAVGAAQQAQEEQWVYNVARHDPHTDQLWDLFEDETLDSYEEAVAAQRSWEEEVDGDPVVILRRPKRAPLKWTLVPNPKGGTDA